MPASAATSPAVALVEEPGRIRLALSPMRHQLLDRMVEPTSATQLAAELGLSRQRVNYHLRQLEAAGLVELVEERPRRGFTERVVRATARSFLVDPGVLGEPSPSPAPHPIDRFAADHLVATAAAVMRTVTRMRDAAARGGRRLLTFTLEADVRLATPADVEALAGALTEAVAGVVAGFDRPGGRRYRLVIGAHPAPVTTAITPEEP
jgi:DNA-binding transcriptional ArsR family regulator